MHAEQDTEVTVGGQGPRLVLGAMGGDKGTKMSTRQDELRNLSLLDKIHGPVLGEGLQHSGKV